MTGDKKAILKQVVKTIKSKKKSLRRELSGSLRHRTNFNKNAMTPTPNQNDTETKLPVNQNH